MINLGIIGAGGIARKMSQTIRMMNESGNNKVTEVIAWLAAQENSD